MSEKFQFSAHTQRTIATVVTFMLTFFFVNWLNGSLVKDSTGKTINELAMAKEACELNLPRTRKCIIKFEPEPDNGSIVVEVPGN